MVLNKHIFLSTVVNFKTMNSVPLKNAGKHWLNNSLFITFVVLEDNWLKYGKHFGLSFIPLKVSGGDLWICKIIIQSGIYSTGIYIVAVWKPDTGEWRFYQSTFREMCCLKMARTLTVFCIAFNDGCFWCFCFSDKGEFFRILQCDNYYINYLLICWYYCVVCGYILKT